jgi:hypothetical protein
MPRRRSDQNEINRSRRLVYENGGTGLFFCQLRQQIPAILKPCRESRRIKGQEKCSLLSLMKKYR